MPKSPGLIKGARAKRSARFGLVYAAGAWLIAQVGDIVFDAFGFPGWAMRLLIVALVLGAPVAILAGWFAGARSRNVGVAGENSSPAVSPSDDETTTPISAKIPPVRTRYARSASV